MSLNFINKENQENSIFQLSIWITNQFNEFSTKITKKVTSLEKKIKELEDKIDETKKNDKSIHITIDKTEETSIEPVEIKNSSKISKPSQKNKKPSTPYTPFVNTLHSSPKQNSMILISQHGIKWVIQGDTYSFRSDFHNFGCIWDKKLNGWVIYTRHTLEHITDIMIKKCPSINILWN